MTDHIGGLLFPEEVLTSPWFILLATIVAFNTIIYLGLTLSKFVPWPKQLQGTAIRRRLERFGAIAAPEGNSSIDLARATHLDDPYESLRRSIANRDIPLSMSLVGTVVVITSLVNLLLLDYNVAYNHVIQLFFGLLLIVMALVIGPRNGVGRGVQWVWALLMTVLAALLAHEAIVEDASAPLSYILIVMVATPSVAMAWTPSLVSLFLMLAPFTFATFTVGQRQDEQMALAGLVAAGVGIVLLRMRLRAAMSVGEYWEQMIDSATTDALTGLLSERGQRELMPSLLSTADRYRQPIWAVRIEVTNIKALNKIYGYAYGDELLRSIARVLVEVLPANSSLARWGGPLFVSVGFGQPLPTETDIRRQIVKLLRTDPTTLGKQAAAFDVSVTLGIPGESSVDDLLMSMTTEPDEAGAAISPDLRETTDSVGNPH